MKTVMVTESFYRGEKIEGIFEMVKEFTLFKGESRRNGLKGSGFIKVAVKGETLTRLAPNAKPVKLTVAAEGVGYVVLNDAPVTEFGVDVERELADEGLPAGVDGSAPVALFETVSVPADATVMGALDELRAAFEAASGNERAKLRKRLRRMEAKLA